MNSKQLRARFVRYISYLRATRPSQINVDDELRLRGFGLENRHVVYAVIRENHRARVA
jgi:hypothetical protein